MTRTAEPLLVEFSQDQFWSKQRKLNDERTFDR